MSSISEKKFSSPSGGIFEEAAVGLGETIPLSAEEAELAKFGYKQEFTRDFSWFSTFSFAFSISGLLATVIRIERYIPTAGCLDMVLPPCGWGPASYDLVLVCSFILYWLILGSSVGLHACALQSALLRSYLHIQYFRQATLSLTLVDFRGNVFYGEGM